MQREFRPKTFVAIMFGIGLTSFAAFAFAQPIGAKVRDYKSHRHFDDPIERFGLGRDGTVVASSKPANSTPAKVQYAAVEVGTYRNGKRILVPFEPARKRDRVRERAYAEQNRWRYDNYDADYAYQSEELNSDGRWTVTERYDRKIDDESASPGKATQYRMEPASATTTDDKSAIRRTTARIQAITTSATSLQRQETHPIFTKMNMGEMLPHDRSTAPRPELKPVSTSSM